jgi:hypothetical protein
MPISESDGGFPYQILTRLTREHEVRDTTSQLRVQPTHSRRRDGEIAGSHRVFSHEVDDEAVDRWPERFHEIVDQGIASSLRCMKHPEPGVESMSSDRDPHLTLQHRIGVIKHGVHRKQWSVPVSGMVLSPGWPSNRGSERNPVITRGATRAADRYCQ